MDVLSWHRLGNLSNEKKMLRRVVEFVMETDSTDADHDYFLFFFSVVLWMSVVCLLNGFKFVLYDGFKQ